MKQKKQSELSRLREKRLKSAVEKDKSIPPKDAPDVAESPIKAMLKKLTGALPGLGGPCGGGGSGGGKVIMIKMTKVGEPEADEKPVTGVKKVLEKAKTEESAFTRRIMNIISEGKPSKVAKPKHG